MAETFSLLAKTLFGLENILADELVQLGADNVEIQNRAVTFKGDKALMYRCNLCLRTAVRILKPISTFRAQDADDVYENAKKINWDEFLSLKQTFVIDATVNSDDFHHSRYVTYRVKDAITDQFREKYGQRPSVSVSNPDLYINIHISHNDCTISLDSSGESLHKRGYRNAQNEAPISEALAAGMLKMAGWDGQCDFVDPMCGSGTFLIEAALMALNIPPCIYRREFAFEKWADFDKNLFDEIYNDDSKEREFKHKIYGYDISADAVRISNENIKSAGLSQYIEVKRIGIEDFNPPKGKCLMVTNPPYGERMGGDQLFELYRTLGSKLKYKFQGNDAWVISAHVEYLQCIGMHPSQKIKLINGVLECEYWHFEIFDGKRKDFVKDKKENKKPFKTRKS